MKLFFNDGKEPPELLVKTLMFPLFFMLNMILMLQHLLQELQSQLYLIFTQLFALVLERLEGPYMEALMKQQLDSNFYSKQRKKLLKE